MYAWVCLRGKLIRGLGWGHDVYNLLRFVQGNDEAAWNDDPVGEPGQLWGAHSKAGHGTSLKGQLLMDLLLFYHTAGAANGDRSFPCRDRDQLPVYEALIM